MPNCAICRQPIREGEAAIGGIHVLRESCVNAAFRRCAEIVSQRWDCCTFVDDAHGMDAAERIEQGIRSERPEAFHA